jgi:hypothetical protein
MAPIPPAAVHFDQTCERIALGLVSARVRTRAILELLEEKGIFAPGQFDDRASQAWQRDYETLAEELLDLSPDLAVTPSPLRRGGQGASSEEAKRETQPTPEPPGPGTYYTEALLRFVDDAVACRVRLRAIVELLEERGIFAPEELEQKAELIWVRDYEELALEFYRGRS